MKFNIFWIWTMMKAQTPHESSPIPPYKCPYSSCIRNKFFMTIDGNEFIKSWIYSIMTCVIDILTFMMILMGQKVRWMQEVHLGMGIKRSIWCAVIYETFSFSCIFYVFLPFSVPEKYEILYWVKDWQSIDSKMMDWIS